MDVWKKIQLSPFVPPIWTLVGTVPGVAGPRGPAGPPGSSGLSSTGSSGLVRVVTGVTDGSDAAAGVVGEIFTSTLPVGSGTSVVNLTAKTVTSITLTPGRWLIWGLVGALGNTGTTISQLVGGIHTVTNTLPTDESNMFVDVPDPGSGPTQPQSALPMRYVSISSSTIYYLVVRVLFAVSTCTAFGRITAVRI